ALIKEVRYGQASSFRYSPRPGTPAAERPQVDAPVASDRLQRLQALILQQQRDIQNEMIGREANVLFEKPGRIPGQMVGKSDHLHAVHVTHQGLERGHIRRVRITKSEPNSLAGEIVHK
ncbi:MAG: TRAM domain-containing protein, partial [Halocynthiibacter sp.]